MTRVRRLDIFDGCARRWGKTFFDGAELPPEPGDAAPGPAGRGATGGRAGGGGAVARQPFFPDGWDFDAIASRLGWRPDRDAPVVLAHGVLDYARHLDDEARRLSAGHRIAVSVEYAPALRSLVGRPMARMREALDANLRLHPVLSRFQALDFVGHSNGGVVVMDWVRHTNSSFRVRSVVTVASPQGGLIGSLVGPPAVPQRAFAAGALPGCLADGPAQYVYHAWSGAQGDACGAPGREWLRRFWNFPAAGAAEEGAAESFRRAEVRRQMLAVGRVLFVTFEGDQVLKPPEAALMYFVQRAMAFPWRQQLVPLRDTELWTEDYLGLRALHVEGRLFHFVVKAGDDVASGGGLGLRLGRWHDELGGEDLGLVGEFLRHDLPHEPSQPTEKGGTVSEHERVGVLPYGGVASERYRLRALTVTCGLPIEHCLQWLATPCK